MVGWRHRLDGRTLGDGEGQGSPVCCSPRGRRVRHFEQLNNNSNSNSGQKGPGSSLGAPSHGHSSAQGLHLHDLSPSKGPAPQSHHTGHNVSAHGFWGGTDIPLAGRVFLFFFSFPFFFMGGGGQNHVFFISSVSFNHLVSYRFYFFSFIISIF